MILQDKQKKTHEILGWLCEWLHFSLVAKTQRITLGQICALIETKQKVCYRFKTICSENVFTENHSENCGLLLNNTKCITPWNWDQMVGVQMLNGRFTGKTNHSRSTGRKVKGGSPQKCVSKVEVKKHLRRMWFKSSALWKRIQGAGTYLKQCKISSPAIKLPSPHYSTVYTNSVHPHSDNPLGHSL